MRVNKKKKVSKTPQIGYNCSECSSIIEILSINENNNTIEFNCINNNHNYKKIKIKDYLQKMKKYNFIHLNIGACNIHGADNLVFCFECSKHLCKECLKFGTHSFHYKILLLEITPNSQTLTKIKNLINENKSKIKNLNKTQKEREKIINNIIKHNINKINNARTLHKERNNNNEKEELKRNYKKY